MSKELHQLIKSLSKGEKRALVISAEKTDGNKKFIELYYALLSQKVYDEKKLLEEFNDKAFVNHFGFTKNYLQNFILKELRHINTEYKVSIKLKNYLIDIELLFWKGQFKLAVKLINQAKVIAEKYEYPLLLEELYYWERRVFTSGSMKIPKVVNLAPTSRFQIMEDYSNALEYKKIINEVTAIIKESDEIRDENDLEKINKILENPLLADVKNAKSKKAVFDFYTLKASLNRLKGDANESLFYYLALQKFIKTNSHIFIEENPIFFLASCNNIMLNALRFENWELYDSIYNQVTNIELKEEYSSAYYNSRIYMSFLSSAIQRKEFLSVKKLALKENILLDDLITDELKLLINYYCVVINFHCKDYKEALSFINKIINSPKLLRVDVVGSVMIFNIMTHFELGNFEHIENILPQHIHFLKKHRLLSLIDLTFMKGFYKLANCSNKTEIKEALKEVQLRLKTIKNKKTVHDDVDYMKWVEEKINTIS